MMVKCRGGMVGLVAVFLFMGLISSPALCRPQPLKAGGNPAINSTTSLDAVTNCDLEFCVKRICLHHGKVVDCYCCAPDLYRDSCYDTMNKCRANCPACI
ncbi:hypothetical protein EJB05_28683, partial [Eragrostis curvula]